MRAGPQSVGGVRLKHPVIPASGTFGLGHGRVFDLNRLGALVPKTVTPLPRTGHPSPRLVEAAGGLMNAIGIPSSGIDVFLREELAAYLAFEPPIIVSISAGRPDEFAALCARLSGTGVAAVEVNLSCPNLEGDGHLFALSAASSAAVIGACRAATALPIWAKLSPAANNVPEIAAACVDQGASAVICGNTMPALALAADGSPRLSNRTGGLSGAPLKPVALRIVDEVARSICAPVVGCGGVATVEDARDFFNAGAAVVAVGSATLSRPTTMLRLIEALEAECTAPEHAPQTPHSAPLDPLTLARAGTEAGPVRVAADAPPASLAERAGEGQGADPSHMQPVRRRA